jgi:membrane-associated phospholipid phosphatase
VSGRLRRWLCVVSMVAVACLTGFGFAARHAMHPLLFDASADAFLRRSSALEHRVAVGLSEVGKPTIFIAIIAFIAVALLLVGDYRAAVAAVVSVGVAMGLVEDVLKPFFDRRLGSVAGPTFPSGHTAVAVALAGAVMLAASGRRPLGRLLGPVLRRLLVAVVLVLSCTIGLAMVVLRFHYLTDVVAGIPLGLAVSGCTAVILDAVAARWQARRPSSLTTTGSPRPADPIPTGQQHRAIGL